MSCNFFLTARIASFLREVFGLTPSKGSLVNWVNEAKRNAQPVIDKIKEYIKSSAVVGFDESGLYCNKRLDWAWIAQTVYYTLLFRADGKGSKVLADKFGDSLERMPLPTAIAHTLHSIFSIIRFVLHTCSVNCNISQSWTLNKSGLRSNQSFPWAHSRAKHQSKRCYRQGIMDWTFG